jgi:WD40 repeat protein
MKQFSSGLLAALISQATVAVVQPSIAVAQSAAQVNSIAKQITVLIEGPAANGSGIIVNREGNIYRILTAAHVVRDLHPTEEAYVITGDRQRYQMNTSTIKTLPDADLAIVEFRSDRNYPIASLGDSDRATEGATVYVAGFPLPTEAIDHTVYNFVPGQISAKASEFLRDGYNLVYTNDTLPGMSGGPVLNERGEVIGVHGRADTTSLLSANNSDVYVRTGFGLGIPINTYKQELGISLVSQEESSPAIAPSSSPRNPENSSETPKIVAYRSPDNFSLVRSLGGDPNENLGAIHAVAISPDGRTLVTGNHDKTVRVWDLATGNLKHRLVGHQDLVTSVAISRDGQTLVSASQDKTIKIWNLATGELQRTLTGHTNSVTSVAMSPDGKTLVSGSADKTIKIWNLANGNPIETLTGHKALVRSVVISPDGKTLVSGSYDTTIKVWDLPSGQSKKTLTGHSSWVNAVAISPDGKTLVSGSDDNTIKIWDFSSGQLKDTLKDHSRWVNAVAISPDGKTLVSGSADNTIKIWDLASGELKRTLTGHDSRVNAVAISADGQTLVSGSSDLTLKIWQGRL